MADWKDSTALVVVDVQKGFDDEVYWGPRNNPDCEENVARLIEEWRSEGWPGNELKDVVVGEPDLLVTKSVHSAFYGEPDLDRWLQDNGIGAIAVCGIQTNLCCETTARMASDLGYDVLFVIDATHTFDIVAPNHQVYRAREIARYTALNLAADFARVVQTRDLV